MLSFTTTFVKIHTETINNREIYYEERTHVCFLEMRKALTQPPVTELMDSVLEARTTATSYLLADFANLHLDVVYEIVRFVLIIYKIIIGIKIQKHKANLCFFFVSIK
jgi:hypothetical protein